MSDFKAKMHQIQFRLGLRPRPRWGILQRSPDPLAEFKGPTSKEREGREGKGGEGGREGEGRGRGKGRGCGGARKVVCPGAPCRLSAGLGVMWSYDVCNMK